jgi:histidinol-phosphate aminotransferase
MTDGLPMPISPRLAVTTLPPYHAPSEGRASAIRLDFNEATTPVTATPIPLSPHALTLYPEYGELTQQLAQFYGLNPDQLLLTNGSDEALFLIPFTFISPGDTVLISQPTFGMIPHYLGLCQAHTVPVPVVPQTLALDEAAWTQALIMHTPKLVVLPSPDNPTGATVTMATWVKWLAANPHTLFVLDQAYGEYDPDTQNAVLPLVAQHANLLITRTFSKAWGLAGLRLGVVLGQPQLIQWLAQVRSPFSVNQAAVQAVQQLLPLAPQVLAMAQATMQRKHQLITQLNQRGVVVHVAGGNFMLLHLGLDATLFCQFMAQRGILLRDRSMVTQLAGMVRLSVGTATECEAFLAALDHYQQTTVLMFDLDDTLVDTSQSFDTVVMELVETYTGQPLTRQALYALRAEGGFNDDWTAIAALVSRHGATPPSYSAIAAAGTRLYLQRAHQTEQLMLPMAQLHALKQRFKHVAIATGRYRQEYDAVWADRLASVMAAVVCVDDDPTTQPKPAPHTLQRAMALTGCTQGLYVGNAVDDMRAATAAGLVPVGVVKTLPAEALQAAGAAIVLTDIMALSAQLPVALLAGVIN